MSTKLTLTVDPEVIAAAKRYARREGTSVSNLVERFLATLTTAADPEEPTSPLLRELEGCLQGLDPDRAREDHLREKYGVELD